MVPIMRISIFALFILAYVKGFKLLSHIIFGPPADEKEILEERKRKMELLNLLNSEEQN